LMQYTFPYGSSVSGRPKPSVGDRWNRLIIQSFAGYNERSKPLWKCRCVCGKEKIALEQSIRNGRTRSCGCAQREGWKKRHTVHVPVERRAMTTLFTRYRANARLRNVYWGLSREEFELLVVQPCSYCGEPPDSTTIVYERYPPPKHKRKALGHINYTGIDRIDNKEGYTTQNSTPCCFTCNFAKRALTLEQFKSWVMRVAAKFQRIEQEHSTP